MGRNFFWKQTDINSLSWISKTQKADSRGQRWTAKVRGFGGRGSEPFHTSERVWGSAIRSPCSGSGAEN